MICFCEAFYQENTSKEIWDLNFKDVGGDKAEKYICKKIMAMKF